MTGLADIFREYDQEYRRTHSLSTAQIKAMRAIEDCRTAALGGHIDQCDHCHALHISYNSCRNRHCPQCQMNAATQWIEERKEDLLPVHYFHIVFTLPDSLYPFIRCNERVVYALFFKAAAETLIELAEDPHFIGGTPGIISILHTWGQNLMYHPHIHCLVTGGGLAADKTSWRHSRDRFFLPVRVLSAKFRGKFLSMLRQAFAACPAIPTEDTAVVNSVGLSMNLLSVLGKIPWVVYCKQPLSNPAAVLEYLGRYTHRVAISNHRIIACEQGQVHFKWKDYKDNNNWKIMILPVFEFIRRFLLHVLPGRFVKIRYYGLLSNRNRRQNIARCRKIISLRTEIISARSVQNLSPVNNLKICPLCGKGLMVTRELFLPHRLKPPNIPGVVA